MSKLEFKKIKRYYLRTLDKDLNKLYREEVVSNSKNYFSIGNLASGSSFYKYFPIGNAIKCLEKNTMAFVEPSRWNDAYERLFYEADYSNVSSDYKTNPRIFATCMTHIKYNEPAWNIYSGEDKVCVQFEIDRARLRYEILKSLNNGDSVYEGIVQYDSKGKIQNIGKKKLKDRAGNEIDNNNYNLFIANAGIPFSVVNYLNLLLLKRTDFRHEQESRLFIVKKEDIDNEAPKATESTSEISDASGRKTYQNYGEVRVLNNINWINVLKSITINVDKGHYAYKLLHEIVNQMIDREVFDALQIKELKKKLEPISYLVYGTTPAKVTIDR